MGRDKRAYLKHKLDNWDLETLFEHFDLDPEEVFMLLNRDGHFDIDYFMDDEFFEIETEDDED